MLERFYPLTGRIKRRSREDNQPPQAGKRARRDVHADWLGLGQARAPFCEGHAGLKTRAPSA
jgi:hypothetical protein